MMSLLRVKVPLIIILYLLFLGGCQAEPRVPEVIATVSLYPPAGGPEAVAVNPETGYVYVVNNFHVAVLREDTLAAILPIGDQSPISALAVDAEGGWAYVLNGYDDSVTVIRGTEVITTLETIGAAPADVVVEPRSGRAYVVSGYRKEVDGILRVVEGNVTVISGPQVVGVIPLGDMGARHMAADPISSYVYVGGGTGDVTVGIGGEVVVVKGMDVVARFDSGSPVQAMDVDPRTGDVYVLSAYGELALFRSGEIVAVTNVEEDLAVQNMRVHPTTGVVYIVTIGGRVRIVRGMRVVEEVIAGWGARKMAIDPVTGNVYVANFNDSTVTVIHGTEVLATIDVGAYPYGIGVNPANGWVYVSNTHGNSVTVLGFREEE